MVCQICDRKRAEGTLHVDGEPVGFVCWDCADMIAVGGLLTGLAGKHHRVSVMGSWEAQLVGRNAKDGTR